MSDSREPTVIEHVSNLKKALIAFVDEVQRALVEKVESARKKTREVGERFLPNLAEGFREWSRKWLYSKASEEAPEPGLPCRIHYFQSVAESIILLLPEDDSLIQQAEIPTVAEGVEEVLELRQLCDDFLKNHGIVDQNSQ